MFTKYCNKVQQVFLSYKSQKAQLWRLHVKTEKWEIDVLHKNAQKANFTTKEYGWSVQLTYRRKDLGWVYIKHMHTTVDITTLLRVVISHIFIWDKALSLPIPTKCNFVDIFNFI